MSKNIDGIAANQGNLQTTFILYTNALSVPAPSGRQYGLSLNVSCRGDVSGAFNALKEAIAEDIDTQVRNSGGAPLLPPGHSGYTSVTGRFYQAAQEDSPGNYKIELKIPEGFDFAAMPRFNATIQQYSHLIAG